MMNPVMQEAPSELMGTIAVMGFSAEDRLRAVARALSQRDLTGLSKAAERSDMLSRLRAEIERQIVDEMAKPTVGTRARHKLVLASQVAVMFERMGSQTVEIAQLCAQVVREPRQSRVTELRKLIEHAVYITDRAATGLVEEELEMARIAIEQKRTATELNIRINRDLANRVDACGESAVRADLLCRIACKAHGIIEEAGLLAHQVVEFLEKHDH
jgi:phosphate uptake regulator